MPVIPSWTSELRSRHARSRDRVKKVRYSAACSVRSGNMTIRPKRRWYGVSVACETPERRRMGFREDSFGDRSTWKGMLAKMVCARDLVRWR
jgi:hypothetical protein